MRNEYVQKILTVEKRHVRQITVRNSVSRVLRQVHSIDTWANVETITINFDFPVLPWTVQRHTDSLFLIVFRIRRIRTYSRTGWSTRLTCVFVLRTCPRGRPKGLRRRRRRRHISTRIARVQSYFPDVRCRLYVTQTYTCIRVLVFTARKLMLPLPRVLYVYTPRVYIYMKRSAAGRTRCKRRAENKQSICIDI